MTSPHGQTAALGWALVTLMVGCTSHADKVGEVAGGSSGGTAAMAAAPSTGAGDEGTNEPSPSPAPVAKKRAQPDPVEPVVIGNVRYEVLVWGRAHGLEQNGGYIAAIDTLTGARLWLLRVYEVNYDPSMEADKQDVFISELRVAPDNRSLLVTTERGARYHVDIETRAVTR